MKNIKKYLLKSISEQLLPDIMEICFIANAALVGVILDVDGYDGAKFIICTATSKRNIPAGIEN